MRTYWQLAAGDHTMQLEHIFFSLGIAMIGPGRYGDFFENEVTYQAQPDGHLVEKFAKNVQIGDVFVLKRLLNSHTQEWIVLAIGEVISPYQYNPMFNRVSSHDWDMQHCRRVKWEMVLPEEQIVSGGAPIRIQRLSEHNEMQQLAKKYFS